MDQLKDLQNRVSQLEREIYEECGVVPAPRKPIIESITKNPVKVDVRIEPFEFTDLSIVRWVAPNANSSGMQVAKNNVVSLIDLPLNTPIEVKVVMRGENKTFSDWSEPVNFKIEPEIQEPETGCSNDCNFSSVSSILMPIWEAVHVDNKPITLTWAMLKGGSSQTVALNPNYVEGSSDPNEVKYITVPNPPLSSKNITEEEFKSELEQVFFDYEKLFQEQLGVNIAFQFIEDYKQANFRFDAKESLFGGGTIAYAGPIKRTSNGIVDKYLGITFYINHTFEPDCSERGGFSVQRIAGHELGHCFGLSHGVCKTSVLEYDLMRATANSSEDLCDSPWNGSLSNDKYLANCIKVLFSNPDLKFI